MSTPYESVLLNLQHFELRREAVLREAREWFTRDFNPQTLEELLAIQGRSRRSNRIEPPRTRGGLNSHSSCA